MYEIKMTGRFKKDIILLQKRGYNIALLEQVIEIPVLDEKLPKNTLTTGSTGSGRSFVNAIFSRTGYFSIG